MRCPPVAMLTANRSVLATVFLVACGGGGGSDAAPSGSDVDAFLRGLPSWDVVSPPVVEFEGPVADPVETDDASPEGEAYRCTRTEYELASNPDEIATASPDAAVLWPGALLHGDSHLSVGSLRLLAVRQDRRAPLGLSLQGGGVLGIPGGVSVSIDEPVGSTVREGINQLVAGALEADVAVGAGTSSFTLVESHSTEQSMMALGLDARYLGVEVSGSASEEKSVGENVVTATFVQRLFTVAVDPPESPGDLFAPEVRAEELEGLGVGPDNLPLYIDSVAYGRMLIVSMRSTDSAAQIKAALDFSYDSPIGGVAGYAEEELASTLATANIEIFALGGPNAGVQNLIATGSLYEYFESELQINQVEPISFTVRNVGDNRLAAVGATTSYEVETCELVSAGLVQPTHHWRGDGTGEDEVGDHHFDSWGGAYGAGQYGQSFVFDGVSNAYLLNHLAPLPIPTDNSFSISAWVYPRESRFHTIAGQLGESMSAGDFALRVTESERVQLFRRPVDFDSYVDEVISPVGSVPLNTWSHLTGVYGPGPDGENSMRVYIDGVLASDVTVPSTYVPARGDTFFRMGVSELGEAEGTTRYKLFGELDEVMTFDQALSSDEVLIHHERFEDYL